MTREQRLEKALRAVAEITRNPRQLDVYAVPPEDLCWCGDAEWPPKHQPYCLDARAALAVPEEPAALAPGGVCTCGADEATEGEHAPFCRKIAVPGTSYFEPAPSSGTPDAPRCPACGNLVRGTGSQRTLLPARLQAAAPRPRGARRGRRAMSDEARLVRLLEKLSVAGGTLQRASVEGRIRADFSDLRERLAEAENEIHAWRDTAECASYMELATKWNAQDARLAEAEALLREFVDDDRDLEEEYFVRVAAFLGRKGEDDD